MDAKNEARAVLLLYVEDEPPMAEVFLMMAKRFSDRQRQGIRVEWVKTLAEGKERARKIPPPDLIFVDLTLTDSKIPMQTVRELPFFQEFGPVEVLSGNPDPEVRTAVEALGIPFHDKMSDFPSMLDGAIRRIIDWRPASRREKETSQRLQAITAGLETIREQTQHE